MTKNLCTSHLQLAVLASVLVLGGVLASGSASAAMATAGTAQDNMMVQTEAGVSYLNGGIGASEQEQMRHAAHSWPLHMTFSEGKAGAFVADASVKVMNKAGKAVFDVQDAGPLLYVKLSPGEYRVMAEHAGKSLTRDVYVGKTSSTLYFRW